MKKIIAMLLVLAMALSLVACGGKADDSKTVVYWSMWESTEPQGQAIAAAVEQFTAETGIKVDLQFKGRTGIREGLQPALDAGQVIDVFDEDIDRVNTTFAPYLLNLEELAKKYDYEKTAIAGLIGACREVGGGQLMTIPYQPNVFNFFYNAKIFEEVGVAEPTTWAELLDVCAKIKAIDPNSIPLGYDSESNWFITMCEQSGSAYTSATGDDLFLFDNETNRAFVARFREWYQKGYVTTQEISGGYTSELFTKAESDVGNSYMSIGSSAGATHQRPDKVNDAYPFEVGIATIPQLNAANPKVISQGPSLCIFKKNDPQEVMASWLFVKFLTTTVEFQAEFSMASGYVPVLKSVASHPVYADFIANANGGDNVAALSAKVCLAQESYYYTSPAFNGSSTARDQVGALLSKCLTADAAGDVDKMIKSAFEDAVEECEYSN